MKRTKELFIILFILVSVTSLNVSQSYASSLFDDLISLFSSDSEIQEQSSDINDHGLSSADEIIEKRTINSKTYKNNNGTYTAIIEPRPIHYKDSANNWRDINTFLVDSSDSTYEKESIKGIAKTRFPKAGGNADIVSIQAQGGNISFRPVGFGKNKTLNLVAANTSSRSFNKNKAKYSNVYSDTDILYTIEPDGVKEEIILNKYTGANVFAFNVKASGLKITKESDGSLRFIDKESGEPVFSMPAPFSFDSGNEFDLGTTTYEYEELGSSNYLVKVVVDDSWLSSSQRVYPVTIDPTIKTLQYGESGTNWGKDTSLHQAFPDTKYGSTGYLSVGEDGNSNDYRSLVQINPSTHAIPTSASIVDARWGVYMYNQSSSTGVNITLDIINSLWWETGATWNNQPSYLYGPNYGIEEIKNVGGTYGWKEWDITSVYRSWHNGQRTNYGLMMFVNNSNNYNIWKQFYSQEGQTKPRIIVKYSQTPSATNLSPGSSNFTNDSTPQLSWTFTDEDSGDTQTKYRVQVFNTSDYTQAPVRDTLTVSNSVSNWTPSALSPDRRYWWRVKVYDSYEWSNWTATVFKLDTTGPNGSVLINNDDAYTNSTNVTLNLSASDPVLAGDNYAGSGLKEMRIQDNDGTTWPSEWTAVSSNSYSATTSYSLSPGDGTKTVRVQYKDDVGNISERSDTIILDSNYIGTEKNIGSANTGLPLNASVNLKSGNLYINSQDLYVRSLSPSLKVERRYNHQDNTSGEFGNGWKLAIPKISFLVDGNLMYEDETGARHVYKRVNSGGTISYNRPPGQTIKIEENQNGFIATHLDKNKETFDLSGKLTSIYDSNGNTTTYTWNGSNQLTKISDEANQEINLTYSSGLISQTYDHTARTVSYGYTSGNLTQVTNIDNVPTNYTYENGLFKSVKDVTDNEYFVGYENGKFKQTYHPVIHEGHQMTHTTSFSYSADKTTITLPDSESSIEHYLDKIGRTTKTIDLKKADINFEYDLDNNLTKETIDNDGELIVTSYTFNSDGRELSKTDALGGVETNQYNSNGNLTRFVNVLGATTSYTYYPNTDNIHTETNALGYTTTYSYDQYGQLYTIMNPRGYTTTTSYDNKGNLLYRTDELGNMTTYQNDDLGNVKLEVSPLGATTAYDYNELGQTTQIISPIMTTTAIDYDDLGRKHVETAPDGQTTTTSYNEMGHVEKVETPFGVTTSSYDVLGNKTIETTPIGSTEYTYTAGFHLETVKDNLGNETQYEYDKLGRKIKEILPNSGWIEYKYDKLNRKIRQANSEGNIITTSYDAAGNIRNIINSKNEIVTNSYDILSRLIKVTNADNSWVEYDLDPEGNRLKEILSTGKETSFEYDGKNQIINEISSAGKTTSYSYDAIGNQITEMDPSGQTKTLQYHLGEQLKNVIEANGDTKTHSYDQLGRKTDDYSIDGHSTYNYNNLSQLTSRYEPLNGMVSLNYDEVGRQSSKSLFGRTIGSTFDDLSRREALYDPLFGTFSYSYNNISTVDSIIRPNLTSSTFSYDTAGRMEQIDTYKENNRTNTFKYAYDLVGYRDKVISNGMTNSYGYDAKGQMEYSAEKNANSSYPHTKYVWYDYDQNGNRKSMEVMLSKTDSPTKSASMTLSQIVQGVIDADPQYNTPGIQYTVTQILEFLLTGKQLQDSVSDSLIATVVDVVDQAPFIYNYGIDVHEDQLVSLQSPVSNVTYGYSYSTNGYQVSSQDSSGSTTYSWDHKNRLKQQITPSRTLEYEYDIMNRRTSKNVKPNPANGEESTSYLYKYNDYSLMEELIEKKNQAGQVIDTKVIKYTYSDSNTPLGFAIGDNIYFYVTDGHNDVREITDSSGNTIVRYQYDAWGNHIDIKAYASQATTLEQAQELAALNPYRYASYRYDDETGLYYLRERYYDPVIGRFLSKDPEPYPNLYIYSQNNPINRFDPSGRGDKKIMVRAAGDEEWRSKFGSDWKNAIKRRFTNAMKFYNEQYYTENGQKYYFNITHSFKGFNEWDSTDSETNISKLLKEARKDIPLDGAEILAAFTAQLPVDGAQRGDSTYPWAFDAVIVSYRASASQEWKTLRHEIGHLYSMPHCNALGNCTNILGQVTHTCFMNSGAGVYTYYNKLCNAGHRKILHKNKSRF